MDAREAMVALVLHEFVNALQEKWTAQEAQAAARERCMAEDGRYLDAHEAHRRQLALQRVKKELGEALEDRIRRVERDGV